MPIMSCNGDSVRINLKSWQYLNAQRRRCNSYCIDGVTMFRWKDCVQILLSRYGLRVSFQQFQSTNDLTLQSLSLVFIALTADGEEFSYLTLWHITFALPTYSSYQLLLVFWNPRWPLESKVLYNGWLNYPSPEPNCWIPTISKLMSSFCDLPIIKWLY